MKSFLARLADSPKFSGQKDILLTVLPAGLWLSGILLRPFVIATRCTIEGACTPESVNRIDRMSLGVAWSLADGLSFELQNATIVCGILLAFVYHALRGQRWRLAFEDLTLWAQVALWNGFFMELTRLAVQRPRPFVYANPLVLGTEAAHYVSFYSGHTSFVAATWASLALSALARKAHAAVILGILLIWEIVPAMTGYFRIQAGRHFLSDVIVGMLAGTCVALGVHAVHRQKK